MTDQAAGYPSSLQTCRPLKNADPPDGTFEVGLALAGAISAGAYTAGVMDFLIEALDAWERAKAEENKAKGSDSKNHAVPFHDVKLKIITGASAGSIVGGIAAVAMRYDFQHVNARVSEDESRAKANPFYRTWVTDIDVAKLLETKDFQANPDKLDSLLDSTCLVDIAKAVIAFTGPTIDRPYLPDPFRLAYTINNLHGIPYSIDMRGIVSDAGYEMMAHADHVRFALSGLHPGNGGPACPDEVLLSHPNTPAAQEWMKMAVTSLASAAFPLFLKPRELAREIADYDYRFVPLLSDMHPPYAHIKPSWPASQRDPYRYLGVDGGTLNNEPIELARIELAGLLGRNPRSGSEAKRAVVLVDPFPDPAQLGPSRDAGIIKTGLSLISSWMTQSRFKPVDLALAHAETVYSRFIVSPSRGAGSKVSNGFALASGTLGGFGGFLHQQFRKHDYLLGRRNCQQFLRKHFTLPANNPLFDNWNPTLKRDARYLATNPATSADELPIIPLIGALNPTDGTEETLPKWPKSIYTGQNLDTLKGQIKGRADAVYGATVRDLPWYARLYLAIGWILKGRPTIVDGTIRAVKATLRERGLYP